MDLILKIILFAIVLSFHTLIVKAGRGEVYDTGKDNPQKSYEGEEEGKLVPYRTFLDTWEIVLICVFSVILLFLLVGLILYVHFFGWNLPECCKKKNNEYTQIQLQRERKIGEIWKTGYAPRA